MFKKIYFLVIICGVAGYLYFFGVQSLKKLISYNVPEQTDLPVEPILVDSSLSFLKIPDGFKISIIAKDLNNPRVIAFDPKERMLVSETKAGRVSLLVDADKNGIFESKNTLLKGLNLPHGLAFFTDDKKLTYLYVAETDKVKRYSYDVVSGKLYSNVGVEIANLPAGGQHFTRTIGFGPNYRTAPLVDGMSLPISDVKLYISVGSSCDACVETDTWKRATMLESDPEGNYTAEFAGGLRNSVFFTFHPLTGEMWATEMSRDNLGDAIPSDEINIIKAADINDKYGAKRFGWPFCYGNQIKDSTFEYDKTDRPDIPRDCSQTIPATIELPAHSAPLGLAFVAGNNWPKDWQGNLLVAYHGSWNRSEPTGYKIVRLVVDKNGKVSKSQDFITGWLTQDGKIYGRPTDLKFGPDGSLYVSDDAAGMIYKISP